MFEFQTQLIFPIHAVPPAGPLPRGARALVAADARWRRRCSASTSRRTSRAGASTLILGFGGNAWNGQDVAEYLHELYPTRTSSPSIIAATRPRPGSPSAEALIADAPLVYDLAVDEAEAERIDRGRLQHRQRHRRPARGRAQARRADPRHAVQFAEGGRPVDVPVAADRPLLRARDRCRGGARRSKVPVAIIAAERDEIVPPSAPRRFASGRPTSCFDRDDRRAPGTTTSTPVPTSSPRCARRSSRLEAVTRLALASGLAQSIFLKSKEPIAAAGGVNDSAELIVP